MRIGMTNSGRGYLNQYIERTDWRDCDLPFFEQRTGLDKANSFHAIELEVAQSDYASFTKYFPGNCLTSRFSSRRRRVEETVPLGNLDFAAISSIKVSVASIAS